MHIILSLETVAARFSSYTVRYHSFRFEGAGVMPDRQTYAVLREASRVDSGVGNYLFVTMPVVEAIIARIETVQAEDRHGVRNPLEMRLLESARPEALAAFRDVRAKLVENALNPEEHALDPERRDWAYMFVLAQRNGSAPPPPKP